MKMICLSIAFGVQFMSLAQSDTSLVTDGPSGVLPFQLDISKRLPAQELAEKKEGTFVTGLPRLELDPIRGAGVGGNIFVFWNQDKKDPFFEYTAYRHRLNAEFFAFQNGRFRYAINYDAPYIFNSPWRLRIDLVRWEDPNAQYWGIGQNSTPTLRFRDKTMGKVRDFDRVALYEKNLSLAEIGTMGQFFTDHFFHSVEQREQLYNVLGERVFLGGKLRLMVGYEALFTSFSSYQGRLVSDMPSLNGSRVTAVQRPTLVDIQKEDGTWDRFNLTGFTNSDSYQFTSMLAGALIYDTRDFEPDPSNGLFLQYSHEYSAPWLGSNFNFHKFMVQGQLLKTLGYWKEGKGRITFAGLVAFGHVFGPQINFIEMWDLSSQAEAGGILALGGSRSIRGFRETRFVAPTVGLINLELRTRLVSFHFLKQHFSAGIVPFMDVGKVWDAPRNIDLKNWRGAPGLGTRITWNQSTILRLDYGRSLEGGQLFFGFGHIF